MYILGFIHYLAHRFGWKPAPRSARKGSRRTARLAPRGTANLCLSVLRDWRLRQDAIRTLEGLSDAALRDIGVVRFEIPDLVDTALKEGADRGIGQAAPRHVDLESAYCD